MANRKVIADTLKKAAAFYWLKQGMSTHFEVGVASWGKRKADVLSISYKGEIVICEVKSCAADYRTDSKWHEYIPLANRFYLLVHDSLVNKPVWDEMVSAAKEQKVGILVLSSKTGHIECKLRSSKRTVEGKHRRWIITKLAWRSGVNRGNSRRLRLFLD